MSKFSKAGGIKYTIFLRKEEVFPQLVKEEKSYAYTDISAGVYKGTRLRLLTFY